jgi:hypothetical protein
MESENREKTFVVFKDHEGFILNLNSKKSLALVYKKSPLPPCKGELPNLDSKHILATQKSYSINNA